MADLVREESKRQEGSNADGIGITAIYAKKDPVQNF